MRVRNVCFGLLSLFVSSIILASDPASSSPISVDLRIGTNVESRNLVGESDTFPASTTQLVAWSLIKGANEPTKIQHIWLFQGKENMTVDLNVQSSFFRTFSRKTISAQWGKWTVQVKDSNGVVLASKDFIVEAPSAKP